MQFQGLLFSIAASYNGSSRYFASQFLVYRLCRVLSSLQMQPMRSMLGWNRYSMSLCRGGYAVRVPATSKRIHDGLLHPSFHRLNGQVLYASISSSQRNNRNEVHRKLPECRKAVHRPL